MSSRTRIVILLLVVLLLPGCAVGEEPTSTTESGLQPRLAPEKKKAARPRADRRSGKGRSAHGNDPPRGVVTPAGPKTERSSEPDGSPTGSGPSRTPSPGASGPARASVSDARGDADGLGVPAYADLTGADMSRSKWIPDEGGETPWLWASLCGVKMPDAYGGISGNRDCPRHPNSRR